MLFRSKWDASKISILQQQQQQQIMSKTLIQLDDLLSWIYYSPCDLLIKSFFLCKCHICFCLICLFCCKRDVHSIAIAMQWFTATLKRSQNEHIITIVIPWNFCLLTTYIKMVKLSLIGICWVLMDSVTFARENFHKTKQKLSFKISALCIKSYYCGSTQTRQCSSLFAFI